MKAWAADTIERLIWTFLQAFLATITLSDMSTLRTAAIAGAAAALSALKSAVAARFPDTLSPASVVPR